MVDTQPQLVFFTELDAEPLAQLLERPGLVETLSKRRFGLSMGMLDFSTRRAALVRNLTEQGVELTAWLLLSRDEGYWLNVDNYPQAIDQYHRFREWAREESGQGLHLELREKDKLWVHAYHRRNGPPDDCVCCRVPYGPLASPIIP